MLFIRIITPFMVSK